MNDILQLALVTLLVSGCVGFVVALVAPMVIHEYYSEKLRYISALADALGKTIKELSVKKTAE